ncbi:hypothetical protein Cgig2_007621 [Carnegiea gigantea]|uniref:CCHC-type domain-containing protein n=1 Tax=Carnegiea gigantea TaxID=171969 RepID=A0A9Q1JLG1_9CARY|nr:hypothetical protein Cgig2_007621 [Carnegiea gigantea]
MCRVNGKVVDPYSGTVVSGTTSGRSGWGRYCSRRQWWRQSGSSLCFIEGELDDGGGGKVTYVGGWTKSIMLKEDMGLEDVQRKAHREKATQTCDDVVVRGRSGRGGDDMAEEGRKGAGVKRAAVSGSGGCIDDHPQTRLRVGGEIIEMSDDDEISVAGHLEKLGKKMDKHKQDMMKWKNGMEERIEQKLADMYQKMGCITDVECYSLIKLVHPMETHNMGIVDAKTGRVGIRPRRCSKCGEVGHTRRTCCNPHADFDANYEGDVVEVEDLLDGSYVPGNLKCLPGRSQLFTVVNHGLPPAAGMFTPVSVLMTKYSVALLRAIRLPSQLSAHPHPVCILMCKFSGAWA